MGQSQKRVFNGTTGYMSGGGQKIDIPAEDIIFFKLIQMSSPIFASSVTYLIPVVAFCWGLFDNESLTIVQGLGAAIILVGVYFSARK